MTVTRIPGLMIGGIQTRGYAFTDTVEVSISATITSPVTHSTKLYVAVQTGLPLRQIMEARRSDERTAVIDFYDYGARVVIAPPC